MDTIGHYNITYLGSSWLVNQIKSIKRHHQVVYCWNNQTSDEITNGDNFVVLNPFQLQLSGRFGSFAALMLEQFAGSLTRRMVQDIEQRDVRLIHAHFGRAGYYALPAIELTGIPLITSFYGYDLSEYPNYPVWRSNYAKLFEKGTYFMTEGSYMRQTLIQIGCPPEKALLQRLGIDIDQIPFQPRSWQPKDPLNVLQVANIREKKGIPDSIRAFAILHRAFPQARFTLLGDIHSRVAKPIMREVQQIIDQHQLQDAITLLERVPYEKYLQILRDAHIFCQPSVTARNGDTEGGAPVSTIESSASGMMIVATRHCDIPEVIQDGISGLLTEEHNYEQLAEHLIFLARNPDLWPEMAKAGRAHIESNYNLHTLIAQLEDRYTSTIQEY